MASTVVSPTLFVSARPKCPARRRQPVRCAAVQLGTKSADVEHVDGGSGTVTLSRRAAAAAALALAINPAKAARAVVDTQCESCSNSNSALK